MKKLLTLLTVAVFAVGCASSKTPDQSGQASGELDYGDYSSQTMTTKAWDALNAGDYMTAIKYTEKVVEMYEEQAKDMQESMKTGVQTRAKRPSAEVHANWALNDVGTSYYIRGEALLNLGKNEEAIAAYKTVKDQYYYAQTWDPKGWFWSPAEVATEKVIKLSGDF